MCTRIAVAVLFATCGTAAYARGAGAQAFDIAADSLDASRVVIASATSSLPERRPPWFTRREMMVGGLAIVATLAVSPLDRPVAGELQEKQWQHNSDLHHVAQQFAFAGGPGPFVLGAGLYTVGRLARVPRLADIGVHVTESVLLAAGITALGKGISGRALPGVQTSEQFQWGRGFHANNGPYVAFPSGHTAASFAVASALTAEADAWRPGSGRYVGPVVYTTAAGVALARLYQDVHWVSDLPLAAAIGTWSGLTIVGRAHGWKRHAHPAAPDITNAAATDSATGDPAADGAGATPVLERIVDAMSVAPTAYSGVSVGWSFPFDIAAPQGH